ncbi:hypothetical protein L6452_03659 [Arctium lappa]|uniref:Uncharacterized protein n=1 Tax=Arctium lappa TaxID=4217 RepID=A0ACB9FNV2_ARCLA|nr:hypothetical protein L6452_03659 [Arctium lappa]
MIPLTQENRSCSVSFCFSCFLFSFNRNINSAVMIHHGFVGWGNRGMKEGYQTFFFVLLFKLVTYISHMESGFLLLFVF